MNRLNQWLTLVANIGVIGGIVFLALEIQQNTLSSKMAARDSATQGHIDYLGYLLDNQTLAIAHSKLLLGEALNDVEGAQMHVFLQMRWRHYERVFYQWRNGLISDQEWTGLKAGIIRSFTEDVPLWKMSERVWENDQKRFSSDFGAYVKTIRGGVIQDDT
jgi:hypothetical protein